VEEEGGGEGAVEERAGKVEMEGKRRLKETYVDDKKRTIQVRKMQSTSRKEAMGTVSFIGLFCRIQSPLQGSFAKEPYKRDCIQSTSRKEGMGMTPPPCLTILVTHMGFGPFSYASS